jgi:hypothetical protein
MGGYKGEACERAKGEMRNQRHGEQKMVVRFLTGEVCSIASGGIDAPG